MLQPNNPIKISILGSSKHKVLISLFNIKSSINDKSVQSTYFYVTNQQNHTFFIWLTSLKTQLQLFQNVDLLILVFSLSQLKTYQDIQEILLQCVQQSRNQEAKYLIVAMDHKPRECPKYEIILEQFQKIMRDNGIDDKQINYQEGLDRINENFNMMVIPKQKLSSCMECSQNKKEQVYMKQDQGCFEKCF